jgi:putative ABC transport system permease protein
MYMSALERVRDFAVLKAVGATTRTLVLSLAAEAVLTCLIAAALAIATLRSLRRSAGHTASRSCADTRPPKRL